MNGESIELVRREPFPAIAVRGELDHLGIDRLETVFREAAALDLGVVILSLLETSFVSSTSVHAIMAYRMRLIANRQRLLLVVAPKGSVRRILEIVGVLSRVPTFESLDAAVAAAPELSLRQAPPAS